MGNTLFWLLGLKFGCWWGYGEGGDNGEDWEEVGWVECA